MQVSKVRRQKGWVLNALAAAVVFVAVSGLAYYVTDSRGANLVVTLLVLSVLIGGGWLWVRGGGERS